MNDKSEALKSMTESVSLQTLSEKHHVHIVTIQDPQFNVAVKYVFARGHQVGIIMDGIYMVHQEFFTGGKHCNVFIEQETRLIKETFRIKEVVKLDVHAIEQTSLGKLAAMLEEVESIKDKDALNAHVIAAQTAADEAGTDGAQQIAAAIKEKALAILKKSEPDDMELKFALSDLVIEIRETQPGAERAKLLHDAHEILKKLPDSEDLKADKTFILAELANLGNGGSKTIVTPKEEKTQKEIEEGEYNEFIKNADIAFDAKDYKKAQHFYKLADELRPGRNRAIERLELIRIHLKEAPKTKGKK